MNSLSRAAGSPLRAGLRAISLSFLLTAMGACASTANHTPKHGTISDATAKSNAALCEHRVPGDMCVKCHPHLAADFKKTGDWCGEHSVPESQCHTCHSDLSFKPLPQLNEAADFAIIAKAGADVASLQDHLVPGKVMVFDFYAAWCMPCRKVDAHLYPMLNARKDLAVRKLDIATWDTPLAKRYMVGIKELPYVVVFGKDGKQVAAISGLHLDKLDAAIAAASKAPSTAGATP